MPDKIFIGSDHAGYELKQFVLELLQKYTKKVEDKGPHAPDSVDYPDFAHPVSEAVEKDPNSLGVLICGSGNGVAMAANKHEGIRAAICWTKELSELARQHNNANILCIPARFITQETAKEIVEAFFTTEFEGGRHERRVNKISCI